MRRVVVVLAAIALLVGPGAVCWAQPSRDSSGDPDRYIRISIDSVAPNTVTLTSDPVVVVTATAHNVGDRTVRNLTGRLERGAAITTSIGLRTALAPDSGGPTVNGDDVPIADRLGTGQHKQFILTMPLRSDPNQTPGTRALGIVKPGVFPLSVAVNGTPDFAGNARLDDATFLLPVLGVPADPATTGPDGSDSTEPDSPTSAPVPPPAAPPIATTVLWPLAARPRLAGGGTGASDQPVRLLDDDLAGELAKGGRLDELVSALEFAIGPSDRDHKLADSVCLAIDPDLLITVAAMTRGYQVPQRPEDPYGPTRGGTGAAAATSWLDRVRGLAGRLCTVAVPYAQVDLPAVRAVDAPSVTAGAVTDPAGIVDAVLATSSRRGVIWPDSGSIDDDTAQLLRGLGTDTVLLAGSAVSGGDTNVPPPDLVRFPTITAPTPATANPAPPPPAATPTAEVDPAAPSTPAAPAAPPLPDAALHAALIDVSTASALAATGAAPYVPSFAPERARFAVGDHSRGARLQDALAAMAWSAITPLPGYPRSLLLAPPQQWTVNGDEAAAVLAQLATLFRSGLAVPRRLGDLIAQAPDARPFELDYAQQVVDDATPESLRAPIRDQSARLDALAAALVDDPQRELTPRRFLDPLRQDLLRALSLSGRRSADPATSDRTAADTAATERLTRSGATSTALFGGVTVLAPGGAYTLASEQSPLLLVARNDLPVGIRVRIRIDAPSAMTVDDVGEQLLPPSGSRTLQLPAKVAATRNLVVHVGLTTPAGQPLGDPTALSVRSNAYGKALAMITAGAGALLLLLSGRRLWHRFRGQPDRADEGYPSRRHRRAARSHRAPRRRGTSRQRTARQHAGGVRASRRGDR